MPSLFISFKSPGCSNTIPSYFIIFWQTVRFYVINLYQGSNFFPGVFREGAELVPKVWSFCFVIIMSSNWPLSSSLMTITLVPCEVDGLVLSSVAFWCVTSWCWSVGESTCFITLFLVTWALQVGVQCKRLPCTMLQFIWLLVFLSNLDAELTPGFCAVFGLTVLFIIWFDWLVFSVVLSVVSDGSVAMRFSNVTLFFKGIRLGAFKIVFFAFGGIFAGNLMFKGRFNFNVDLLWIFQQNLLQYPTADAYTCLC